MVNGLKIVAIIQCRMSSSRLPAKAMLDLGGKTILERVIESAAQSSVLDEIWVATSEDILDDLVEWKSIRLGCKVFRGDLNDVLDRYCKCTKICHADIVVRITADNPLTHSKFIDLGVQSIIRKRCDYVAFKNIPYGSGVEVITQSALFTANEKSTNDQEREHVTSYILNNPIKFNINIIDCPFEEVRRPDIRVTVDTLEDYKNLFFFFSTIQDQSDALETYIDLFDTKRLSQ